jgi:very-long-chain ceramide synthase
LSNNQLGIAVYLLSILFITHFSFIAARHHTQKFFSISYYNPRTGTFALGWDDIFFVFYWIIVFTGMRCAIMDYILTPVAAWAGIEKKKARVRFAEQAWILIYYTGFWSTGMYIMYNSEYWLNLRALWHHWPMREMDGLAKWYYLVQFAFWLQQIVVVNIEERRKDHWQMFTHHIITCTLVFTSYGYHQTRVGTLILCLMDVVDLFLPLAKILKYLKFKLACDIAFGIFMVTWLVARHLLYLWTCWSIYAHIPQEIRYGCYKGSVENLQGPFPVPNDFDHLTQPFRDPEGLVCWNNNIKWVFLGMLLALQCILLVWFGMIMNVAYKVLSGEGADDTRSDDEDDDEDDDEEEEEVVDDVENIRLYQQQASIEKQVLSTDPGVSFSCPPDSPQKSSSPVRRSSRRKNEGGHSSGVNLLAHGDRKELLGRIGCDKSS